MSTANGTALATLNGHNTAIARFGSDEELRTIMVRSAAIFGIPEEEVSRADVQASLKKATQYCVMYGWLPGIHIHMTPYKKKVKVGNREEWITTYVPVDGEKAWKESADRQAQMQKFTYLVETEELSADDVRKLTADIPGQEYDPADRGFRARVLRSDHARMYRDMGRTYEPAWSYGFWRAKARQKDEYKNNQKTGKKIWESDTVPNGRMPRDVAERRATKAALMKVFSLIPLNDYEESRRFQKLAAYVEEESSIVKELPTAHMLPAESSIARDDDDVLYWGEETPAEGQFRAVDAETGEITEPPAEDVEFMAPPPADAYDPNADWDNIPGAGASASETPPSAHLLATLTGDVQRFAEWCRNKHVNSDGPATRPQYGYLAGVINAITGQDGSHHAVLELMTGRPTSSDNPPGYDLAQKLLDWLPAEKTEKDAVGKKTKTANPAHKPEYVEAIRQIWRTIQEAQGQQAMNLPLV